MSSSYFYPWVVTCDHSMTTQLDTIVCVTLVSLPVFVMVMSSGFVSAMSSGFVSSMSSGFVLAD